MSTTSARSKLKIQTDCLLDDNSTWGERRQAVHDIAQLFAGLGIYDIHTSDREVGDAVQLKSGYAISSWGAAMCLVEVKRTYVFVKAIIEAIQYLQQNEPNKTLQIIDAGCGPFALLSVLPALYIKPGTVKFHLLDIIAENIEAAKKLILALELDDYFGDSYVADACIFKWEKELALDMVISETMLNALRKEPQVAITLNLAPQLAPGGLFIPENIRVDLCVVSKTVAQLHANLFELNKHTRFADGQTKQLATVTMPANLGDGVYNIMYHTSIKVFGDCMLEGNDCSLTLAYRVFKEAEKNVVAGKELEFYYRIAEHPSIRYRFE